MTTFSGNPHPSEDDITGTVCSLLLNNKGSEIKLMNLSESIEVHWVFFYFNSSAKIIWKYAASKEKVKEGVISALHTYSPATAQCNLKKQQR